MHYKWTLKKKSNKKIESLVKTLKEREEEVRKVNQNSLNSQMTTLNKPKTSIYDYERAKWSTPLTYPDERLLNDRQKRLLEESRQEEFRNNMSKLSKIIEAKKHDEEGSVSMYRGFKELSEAGLI